MDERIEAILKSLLEAVGDSYDKTPGYLIYDVLKSAAIELAALEQSQSDTAQLLDVDYLTGDLLAKFVLQRKGMSRRPWTFAVGVVVVNGNGVIHTGDLFETKSGVQFASSETVTITGSGEVAVQCMTPGQIGNVPANQIIQIPVTIAGITSVINIAPTHDGYEAETDGSLRERYYTATQSPVTSGNIYHYIQWAKEVSGVGDVAVFPLARGPNTVDVVIIDQNKQPASSALVNQVQSYIDPDSEGLGNGQAPIGAHCYVLSADGLSINLSVHVQKDLGYTDADVIQNIQTSVGNYLKSIAFKLDYVSYAKVGEAVLNSEGVDDYASLTVNGGSVNVEIPDKNVAIVGGVVLV
jgi:uncharacterized phage protein gp47/JayE